MTRQDYIELFESYLLTQKRVARNTLHAYMHDIKQFFVFLEKNRKQLPDIEEQDLRSYIIEIKNKEFLSARSLARKISSLKVLFFYLHQQHNLKDLAAVLHTPKLEKKLPNFLTENEIQQLLSYAQQDKSVIGQRNYLLLLLLYVTGMRITEAVSLKISGIQFDTGFISVCGKGNKERLIPLPQQVLPELRNYLENVHPKLSAHINNEFLFPILYRKVIKSLTRQAAWAILKKLAICAGIERNLSPHTLRHSLDTHLLENGANLRSLQVWLGHENLSTVEIYTHINTGHLRKVYDKKHPRS